MKKIAPLFLFIFTLSLSPSTLHANSIVCFDGNQGNFCIELFEKQAPVTVANFLKYIENRNYENSIIHRSVPNFIIQTGAFKIMPSEDSNDIVTPETLEPIINEFAISNTRGTVAMAKIGGDPNSATNQWFVNLNDTNADNLDQQNEGFTVFGQIIEDGIQVFDAIAKRPTYDLTPVNPAMTHIPLIDFDEEENSLKISHFALIFPTRIIVKNPESNFQQNVLRLPVDIGDKNFYHVSLNLIQTEPNIVFEVDFSNLTPLDLVPLNAAVFSMDEKKLSIPSVLIEGKRLIRNIEMTLTDDIRYQFTLNN